MYWATLHPAELRSTLQIYIASSEQRCTLLSYDAPTELSYIHPTELRCTLLSYAAPFWTMLAPLKLLYAPYWTKLHPSELRCTLLSYAVLSLAAKHLLGYTVPWYGTPSELLCNPNWATSLCFYIIIIPECRNVRHPVSPVPEWKQMSMPEPVRYRNKGTQSGIGILRYRTEIMGAGIPMPVASASMPMPRNGYEHTTVTNKPHSCTYSWYHNVEVYIVRG